MDERVTFVFYSDWLDSIKRLPPDTQDKIIGEWARHGCKRPPQHEDDEFVSVLAEQRYGAIDASREKYEQKVAQGKKGGRKVSYDREKAFEMKKSGRYTNQELADMFGVAKSTIDHL